MISKALERPDSLNTERVDMESEQYLLGNAPTQEPNAKQSFSTKVALYHERIPIIRRLPLSVIAIIIAVLLVNLIVWAGVGVVLVNIPITRPVENSWLIQTFLVFQWV